MFISTDPNIVPLAESVLGGVTILFIIRFVMYYLLQVDIVLWFRRVFSVLYTNKGNISQQVCNSSKSHALYYI